MIALLTACASPPPDVLIVTLDTTRADAIGAYGGPATPAIDALAASGVRVDEAMSVAPLTVPAHASLMTGLYPARHGVRGNDGEPLGEDARTLAEVLRDAGWRTAAFVSAAVLDDAFGLDQGFDVYEDPGVATRRDAEETGNAANAWLAAQPPGPLLLWVHFYDAHQPVADYDAAVGRTDRQIANLREHLRLLGRERVVVVVAGDHGEGRGDHGEATHGLFVYRSTMRVPLVLAAPGLAPGVRPGPLSLVDVAPTVLALAGAPPLPDIDGASFAEGSPAPRVVLGETFLPRDHFGFSELRFAQDATRRLVEAPSPELYDWRADPGEARDLAAAEPAEVARLRAALGAVAPPRAASLDPGLASRLEALGYLTGGGAVDPAVPGASLPNPKDHPDMIELVETLLVTARTRPPADAVPMLGAFLERWPNTPSVRVQLARALALSGRPREGADALAPLLAARPDDPMLLALRGEMRFAAGEDGEPDLTRATALRPTLSSAWATLAERARAAGDPERAADLATRGLAHVPASPALLLVRGAARIDAGDPAAAVDDLLLLVREDAAHPEARYLLGVALARADRAAEAVGPLEAHLAARPDDARAHAMLGLVLQRVERPADALPHLEIALADPAVAGDDLRVALAACLLQTGGDRARAEALLDAAGDRADAHRLRATLRMDEGRVDDALLEMRRARP